jgi:hypothetical protein
MADHYGVHMTERIVPFTAADGFACNLIHVQGERTPDKGPVLLVHGAGVRANIFRPPTPTTLVDYLLAHGYDVWLENWRASIDLPPNPWTLDQAARYDHPVAVQTVLRETASHTLKAVIHCQGSTSFMMAAVAGLVPEVDTIVANAVSLHPRVPWLAQQKGRYAIPVVSTVTTYLNPQWGLHAQGLVPKLVSAWVALTHHECDNAVCKQASFAYGIGRPTLWRHENLNPAIHDWIKQEFAHVPLAFFRQMSRCVAAGHLLSVDNLSGLPADYVAQPPKTSARIAFVAGQQNNCFLWESQQLTYDYFDRLHPDFHSLQVFADYGHLDVFIGKDAANDTFPILLQELERPH